MKKILQLSALLVIAAGLLTGCASNQPDAYDSLKITGALPQPANNQALVYVYSRDLPLGKTFAVLANGKPVTSDMAYGKFFCFQADPGEMRIASKGHLTGFETPLLLAYYGAVEARKLERVVFTVQAGETYFVDMHNGFARETMTLVSKDKGERKIQNCRRIDAASIQ